MLTIRPVRRGDAPALADLLQPAAHQADLDGVQALIAESRQALDGDGPVPHRLVLVLENQPVAEAEVQARRAEILPAPPDLPAGSSIGALLGAVTLAGSTGLDLPRASYRTGTVVHASAELKMFHRAPTLLLCNDLTGCAELGQPVMAENNEARALQRLLVDAALLFVAAHPDRFAPKLVAELPGIGGCHGASPFWRGLGRHFHARALPQDTSFFPAAERSHIARLMPKHPMYSALLGPDAQACIGRHAASAQTLAEALHAQGLRHRGQVNLFDAGPVLEAQVGDLAAVRNSRRCRVVVGGRHAPSTEGTRTCLLASEATVRGSDWQVGLVSGAFADGVIQLEREVAQALGLQAGQRVRVSYQA